MVRGEFTKEEAQEATDASMEIFGVLNDAERLKKFGHINTIMLFLERARREAPDEVKP